MPIKQVKRLKRSHLEQGSQDAGAMNMVLFGDNAVDKMADLGVMRTGSGSQASILVAPGEKAAYNHENAFGITTCPKAGHGYDEQMKDINKRMASSETQQTKDHPNLMPDTSFFQGQKSELQEKINSTIQSDFQGAQQEYCKRALNAAKNGMAPPNMYMPVNSKGQCSMGRGIGGFSDPEMKESQALMNKSADFTIALVKKVDTLIGKDKENSLVDAGPGVLFQMAQKEVEEDLARKSTHHNDPTIGQAQPAQQQPPETKPEKSSFSKVDWSSLLDKIKGTEGYKEQVVNEAEGIKQHTYKDPETKLNCLAVEAAGKGVTKVSGIDNEKSNYTHKAAADGSVQISVKGAPGEEHTMLTVKEEAPNEYVINIGAVGTDLPKMSEGSEAKGYQARFGSIGQQVELNFGDRGEITIVSGKENIGKTDLSFNIDGLDSPAKFNEKGELYNATSGQALSFEDGKYVENAKIIGPAQGQGQASGPQFGGGNAAGRNDQGGGAANEGKPGNQEEKGRDSGNELPSNGFAISGGEMNQELMSELDDIGSDLKSHGAKQMNDGGHSHESSDLQIGIKRAESGQQR